MVNASPFIQSYWVKTYYSVHFDYTCSTSQQRLGTSSVPLRASFPKSNFHKSSHLSLLKNLPKWDVFAFGIAGSLRSISSPFFASSVRLLSGQLSGYRYKFSTVRSLTSPGSPGLTLNFFAGLAPTINPLLPTVTAVFNTRPSMYVDMM